MTNTTPHDTPALPNDVADLRREVDELRQLVAQLTGARHPNPAVESPHDASVHSAETTSRRHVFRLAAGAAAAGAAMAVGVGSPAAAANGDPVEIGDLHTGTASTEIDHTGGAKVGLLVHGFNGFGRIEDTSAYGALVAGWASAATNPYGVYGFTNQSTGSGVIGRGGATGSSGLEGVADFADAVGVRGSGPGLGAEFNGTRAALRIGSSGPDPTTGSEAHDVGELYADDAGDLWFCTLGGAPGSWVKLTAGPGAAGVLTPVDPFRVYDSRFGDGPLSKGVKREVSVADSIDSVTGDPKTTDAVPAGATAVAFNLTITNTIGAGFVSTAPGGATEAGTSSINWASSGASVANGTFVKLDGSRQMTVFVDGAPGCATDYIIDITGYLI